MKDDYYYRNFNDYLPIVHENRVINYIWQYSKRKMIIIITLTIIFIVQVKRWNDEKKDGEIYV